MKKSIVSIILCLAFAFGGTANAWVQIVAPVIAIGAGALIAAGLNLAVTYGMLPSSSTSHVIASTGDVSRSASANYIEIDMSKIPVVRTKPVHAKMPYSKAVSLSEKTNADSSKKYPLTYSKTHGPNAPDISSSSLVGDVVATSWGVRKITSKGATTYCQLNVSSIPTSSNGGSTIVIQDGSQCSGSGSSSHQTIFNTTSATAPVVPVLPSKFVSNLGLPSGGGSVVDSSLQAELDKMYQDPDYVPSFTDDTTGLPYAPPSGLPSADQIKAAVDAYNRAGALAESKSNVQSANAGAVAAAQASADAAHAAAQSAAGAAAANPGDAGLANAAAQAAAGAAAADAALAQAKADQAKSDNAFTNISATVSDNTPAVAESTDGGTATGLGGLLINRLKTTAGLLSTHAPLSYISGAVDLVSSLVVDPVAPSIDLPLGPWGGVLHISASWFDPLATLTRFFSWLLFILSAAWSFKGYWHRS